MTAGATAGGTGAGPGGARRGRDRPDPEMRRAILWLNLGTLVLLVAWALIHGGRAWEARARRASAERTLALIHERQEAYRRARGGGYATDFGSLGLEGAGHRLLPDGSLQGRVYNFVLTNPRGEASYRVVATANIDRDRYYDILEIAAGEGVASRPGTVRVAFSDLDDRAPPVPGIGTADAASDAPRSPGAAPEAVDGEASSLVSP